MATIKDNTTLIDLVKLCNGGAGYVSLGDPLRDQNLQPPDGVNLHVLSENFAQALEVCSYIVFQHISKHVFGEDRSVRRSPLTFENPKALKSLEILSSSRVDMCLTPDDRRMLESHLDNIASNE
jgi:hypothetical protein